MTRKRIRKLFTALCSQVMQGTGKAGPILYVCRDLRPDIGHGGKYQSYQELWNDMLNVASPAYPVIAQHLKEATK